jgi:hypothetical protein
MKMKHSTTSLQNNLSRQAPLMYNLWEILEWKRKRDEKPHPTEILVARGTADVKTLPYHIVKHRDKLLNCTTTLLANV